jgi:hypothetical protein
MMNKTGEAMNAEFKLPKITPIIPGMMLNSPRKKYLPEASIFPLNEK